MTYLLDDLEKADLVQRQPDPADRRARLIVPTGQGSETLCELERRLATAEDEILGILDESERCQLPPAPAASGGEGQRRSTRLHDACVLADDTVDPADT